MKATVRVLFIFLALGSWACGQKTDHDHQEHDATASDEVEVSANQELYNEVMKIHDEVMPKMDDIHRVKRELKEKITNNPGMSAAERVKTDAMIARLDSAGESMMGWMREFQPVPDSAGEEKARLYLENEMERVKKVRENILQALEEAEANK